MNVTQWMVDMLTCFYFYPFLGSKLTVFSVHIFQAYIQLQTD